MTRSTQRTRELLINAGLDALRELTAADLVTAVGTRELARRAGVSPATFFHHFGTVEVYAAELVRRVFDTAATSAQPGTAEDEHRLRVGVWAFGGEDVRSAYDSHSLAEPPIEDERRFAAGRDGADAMNAGIGIAAGGRGLPDVTERGSGTRSRIVAAADELFARDAADEVSVPMVASAAFVSPSTVYGMFEGRSSLAVAVLLDRAGRTLPTSPMPTPADRRGRLHAVAELLAARRACAAAYVNALIAGASPENDPLLATVEAVVRAAQQAGSIRAVAAPLPMAQSVLLVLAARVLANGDGFLDDVIQQVVDVFLAPSRAIDADRSIR